MKIEKIINNNLIQSSDNNNNEVLVMGCGLGFKKKIGEVIDQSKIEKIYSIENKNYSNKLIELLSDIPLEVIQTTNEIVSYARYSLGKKLNDNIYILLTDHINFSIERINKGLQFKNALLWEIRRFYNHEFLIGKEALQIIKKKLNVDLPEDEAANIALHIVNAQLNSTNMDETMDLTKMIQNILNIVKFHYKLELDEYSLYNDENSLSCVVTLAYLSARDIYRVEREEKTGKGFADFTFHPRRKADSPFILELKKDDNVDSAIKQIKEKEYFQKFIKEHENLLLVAICYDSKMKNHSCKIESVCFKEV